MNPARLSLSFAIAATLAGCSNDPSWLERGGTEPARTVAAQEPRLVAPPAAPTATGTPATVSPVKSDKVTTVVEQHANVRVKRLVVAHDVKGREPVGPATSFDAAGADRIYAFVEVENLDKTDTAIFVSFVRDGEPLRDAGIELHVGGAPRWRTWAFTRLAKKPGSWDVVVRNARGKEIGRMGFEVEGTAPPKAEPAKPEVPKGNT
jgi:DUF2914 family protein